MGTSFASSSSRSRPSLARAASSRSEVRWSQGAERFVHTTQDATGYVRQLFVQHGQTIQDLEVRRASLEDAYMAIVLRQETNLPPVTVIDFEEARS